MENEAETISNAPATLSPFDEIDVRYEAERLIALCSELFIDIEPSVAEKLIRYLQLVLTKNQMLNLTAIREWDKALVLHLADSLTFLEEFDALQRGQQLKPFLDMGCGAGFPGIPLAVARPERKGMLCDSVKKKIKAVDEFIAALDLSKQLTTNTDRLEILGRTHRRAFGCIVARAVAPLPVLVEYAAPLLARNGRLILSKGTPDMAEIESGLAVAELCGLEMISQRIFDLPEDYGQRSMFVYAKVGEPEVKLPRLIGMATKQPLA